MLDLSKLNPGDSNLILHKFMEKSHNKTYAGSNFQSPIPTLTSLRSPHSFPFTSSRFSRFTHLVLFNWRLSRKPYLVRMIQDPGHHVIHVYLLGNSAALSYVHFLFLNFSQTMSIVKGRIKRRWQSNFNCQPFFFVVVFYHDFFLFFVLFAFLSIKFALPYYRSVRSNLIHLMT